MACILPLNKVNMHALVVLMALTNHFHAYSQQDTPLGYQGLSHSATPVRFQHRDEPQANDGFLNKKVPSPTTGRPYRHQICLVTENDRYLMQGNDRYYTSGLMLSYIRAGRERDGSALKRLHHFELGHKLFTPKRRIYNVSEIDRPVTGYMYLKYTSSFFKERESLLQWSASAGVIGKASGGGVLQNSVHDLLSVNSSFWGWVWDYQLKSAVGFNLAGLYAKGWLKERMDWLEIATVSQAGVGTDFTFVNQGVLMQIGKFNEMGNSSLWGANADKGNTHAPEIFAYYRFDLQLQFYNSTVQGGLYLRDKGPVTSDIKRLVPKHQFGIAFSKRRYTMRLEAVIQGKEAEIQRKSHSYAGLHLGYGF